MGSVRKPEGGARGGTIGSPTSELSIDEIQGPVLHHALDSAEVLADEREDVALHAEHGDDERAEQERAGEVLVRDPVDERRRRRARATRASRRCRAGSRRSGSAAARSRRARAARAA